MNLVNTLLFRPPDKTCFMHPSRFFWIDKVEGKEDNRIPCFHIKNTSASLTLLYSHGNGEDLGRTYNYLNMLSQLLRVNIFSYEYDGYGINTGEPSEEKCIENVYAAFRYLTVEEGLKPYDIVLVGQSLGTGPTCHLASKLSGDGTPVAGVILQSPFLSIFRIPLPFHTQRAIMGDMFDNMNKVQSIKCPVFIIHGKRDNVIPFFHAVKLLNAVPIAWRFTPLWLASAGHNDILSDHLEDYLDGVSAFLATVALRNDEDVAYRRKAVRYRSKKGSLASINSFHSVTRSLSSHKRPILKNASKTSC